MKDADDQPDRSVIAWLEKNEALLRNGYRVAVVALIALCAFKLDKVYEIRHYIPDSVDLRGVESDLSAIRKKLDPRTYLSPCGGPLNIPCPDPTPLQR